MSETREQSRRGSYLVGAAIVVLLVPLGFSLVSALIPREAGAGHAFLERPDPKYERCVEATTYMRYHHWELLTRVRDSVMRAGKRRVIGVIGLNRCRECHTSRKNFCDHCHNTVNLYPPCFGCHYYP